MIQQDLALHAPIAWLPAGLISWYSDDGTPLALATSWMALIGGEPPIIRTAWPGRQGSASCRWRGGDFVVNVLTDDCLEKVRQVLRQGRLCFAVKDVFGVDCLTGSKVNAPRLPDCPLQVECIGGVLDEDGFEPELYGEVVLLHRGGKTFGAEVLLSMSDGCPWRR